MTNLYTKEREPTVRMRATESTVRTATVLSRSSSVPLHIRLLRYVSRQHLSGEREQNENTSA